MLKIKQFLIMLLTLLILTGCGSITSSQINDQKIKELEDKITVLETEVDMLNESRGAMLTPEEKGYSIAHSSAGYFFISLDNIEQYLDGYKIHIRIGNPTNVTFDGFILKVAWGKDLFQVMTTTEGEIEDNTNKMNISENFKMYSFTESLKPGFWTEVSFVIPSVKSEDLKNIKVFIETDSIELYEQ